MSLRNADDLQKWLNAGRDADVERILRKNDTILKILDHPQRQAVKSYIV